MGLDGLKSGLENEVGAMRRSVVHNRHAAFFQYIAE